MNHIKHNRISKKELRAIVNSLKKEFKIKAKERLPIVLNQSKEIDTS
jgi:hypothetical protein